MKSKTTYPILIGCLLAAGALVQDASAQAAPKHRYSFTDGGGDGLTVTDSVGGQNGTLINTTGNSTFADGQLTLGNDGSQGSNANPITGDYVDLPNGLFSDLVPGSGVTAFTLEGWYTWQGAGDWQRFYDVGRSLGGEDVSDRADLQPNFFIAVKAGGAPGSRAAWTGRGIGEVSITSQNPADAGAGVPHHVAFVWDEATTSARYYVDGTLIGENTATAMTVQNDFAGDDVNNWLGRSNWPDTLFVGSFDEFRIYDEALSEDQILANLGNGPDALDGPGLGALTEIVSSAAETDMILGGTTSINTVANYENFSGRTVTNFEGMTYSSDNTAAATVDENGVVSAVNAGSANITVSYEGLTSVVAITVSIPPFPEAVLQHRYSFSDAVGSDTVMDSVGTAHGEARGITFDGSGSAEFVAENFAHVALPSGIISSLDNVTLESWATYSGLGGAWQRIWDIGTTSLGKDPSPLPEDPGYDGNGTPYMFFTPRVNQINVDDDGGRFAFQQRADGENPVINLALEDGPTAGEEFHLVVVYNYSQRIAQVWVNGALGGQLPIPADRPLSELEDDNVWLGRSQWKGDGMLNGSFNEFRIYEGALSPFEIAVNATAGPDQMIADPGAAQSITLQINGDAPVAGGAPLDFSLIADFEAIQGVDISGVPGVNISSDDTSVVAFLNGNLIPVGVGTATITATLDGESANTQVTVGPNPTTPVLEHRYSFNGDLVDSVGGLNDGTLQGGAVFENGGVTLPGGANDAGYIDLPDYMFSDYYFDQTVPVALTFELYGNWAGGAVWQRMLDFGDNDGTNGRTFLFISPSDGGGLLRANFTNDNDGGLEVTGPGLVAGEDFYVALVFDPLSRVMRLYRNGSLVGLVEFHSGFDFTNDLLDLVVNDENEWLGRSQFSADAAFAGSITEYRVWNGALLDADIALHAACGPDELTCEITGPTDPLPLSAGLTAEGVVISWPSEGENLQLQMTDVISPANWQDVTTTPVTEGDTTSVTISDLTGAGYFRLINQ